MYFVDTHAHLFLSDYDDDRKEVIQRANNSNIKYFIIPNIDVQSIPHVMSLCHQYPDTCYPLLGLHPSYVKEDYTVQVEYIEKQIIKENVIGVGEIGLDFYWDKSFKNEQIQAFSQQLALAVDLDLPVVIHVRNSLDTVLKVIKENGSPKLRGVFHCFNGSFKEAKKIIDMGFYLGIGGILTFKNSKLDKTLAKVPVERIVLETDAPYLAPDPFRGKRNESSYIIYIAQKLAEIYNMNLKEIAKITSDNTNKIFNVNFQ